MLLRTSLICFSLAGSVYAIPNAPLHSHKQVDISKSENHLTITSQHTRNILKWDSFSIGENQSVHFQLPGATSAILNRVAGHQHSVINGKLSSNGNVVLINPQGLLIGKNGLVQTAGFIASTHDVSDHEFLNQNQWQFFKTNNATIENQGKIVARNGNVLLIASKIEQNGDIETENGKIHLYDADQILVSTKQGVLSIQPQEKVSEKDLDSPFSHAIKQAGNLRQFSVEESADGVVLISESSSVEVSGNIEANHPIKGGTVILKAPTIDVFESATIDVKNPKGTIAIGDKEISKRVFIQPGSHFNAKSGNVIFWSREHTDFDGNIEAEGGFVEISSLGTFAPNGSIISDHILLDPCDIFIGNYSSSPRFPTSSRKYEPTGATAYLNFNQLQSYLNRSDVTISTSSGTGGNGNITIGPGKLMWRSGKDLSLTADNKLSIQCAITAARGANFTFTAPTIEVGSGSQTAFNFINASSGILTFNASDKLILNPGVTPIGSTISINANFMVFDVNNMVCNLNNSRYGKSRISAQKDLNFHIKGDLDIHTYDSAGSFFAIHSGSNTNLTVDGNLTSTNGLGSFRVTATEDINFKVAKTCHIKSDGYLQFNANKKSVNIDVGEHFILESCGKKNADFNLDTRYRGHVIIKAGGNIEMRPKSSFCPVPRTVSQYNTSFEAGNRLFIPNGFSIQPIRGSYIFKSESDMFLSGVMRLRMPYRTAVLEAPSIQIGSNFTYNGNIALNTPSLTLGFPDKHQTNPIIFQASRRLTYDLSEKLSLYGGNSKNAYTIFSKLDSGNLNLKNIRMKGGLHPNAYAALRSRRSSISMENIGDLKINGGNAKIDIISGYELNLSSLENITIKNNVNFSTRLGCNIIAGKNFSLLNNSSITSSSGQAILIVTDNLFPEHPTFGEGAFHIDATSSLSSVKPVITLDNTLTNTANLGEVRIFSVSPSLNTVENRINSVTYTPDPIGSNNNFEQFDSYHPATFYGGPGFTFYFKSPETLPPPPPVPAANKTNSHIDFSCGAAAGSCEMLWDLKTNNPFIVSPFEFEDR